MPILVVAAVIYIAWWLYAARRAMEAGIADGEVEALRRRQNYWAGIYSNLTRSDWESLGISEEILRELVGPQNYRKLVRKWYPRRRRA